MPIGDVCPKAGISQATMHAWRKKCAGLLPSEMRRLKALEDENARLKKLVAELSLDRETLRGASRAESSEAGSDASSFRRAALRLGRFDPASACGALRMERSTYHDRSRRSEPAALLERIREIRQTRLHVQLRREGRDVNHKKVHRICNALGLQRRNKSPKRRAPTVVDTFSRFSSVVDPRFSYRGEDVVATLERVCAEVGFPKAIRVDQGSEFISRGLDLWACRHGVVLDFSRPGKPTDNAFIEAFNGKFRQECLRAHWFLSLAGARGKREAWRRFCNEERPHGAIGYKAPISLTDDSGAPGQRP